MTDRQEGLLLVGVLLVISFFFQIQMKLFANDLAPLLKLADQTFVSRIGQILVLCISWRAGYMVVLAGLLFIVWLLSLTRLELSIALPLASVGLFVNAVGAGIVLGETMTVTKIVGIFAVAIGIALVLAS